MDFVKLQQKARSTQTVTEFGGLWHNEETALGRWYDLQNLSADGAPALTVRRRRARVTEVDGMAEFGHILAACGTDRLVILDEYGDLRCGARTLHRLLGDLWWHMDFYTTVPGAEVSTSKAGSIQFATAFGELRQTVTLTWRADEDTWGRYEGPDNWVSYNLDTIGLRWESDSEPTDGAIIRANMEPRISYKTNAQRTMVQMGANIIVFPDKRWANVVDLANGAVMVEGTNYGSLEQKNVTTTGTAVTLTMCDLDGEPYDGVVTSKTEPQSTEATWVDISGDKTSLRAWSASYTMWTVITSTYIRVKAPGIASGLERGDAVTFKWKFQRGEMARRLYRELRDMLNQVCYLYEVHHADPEDAEDVDWVLISGVMSTDETTITTTEGRNLSLSRNVPDMDFVVECDNRLWGCYYGQDDEGKTLNEIYACKLGDPKNWRVYQGLSTDSYTASRGSSGPYTGASVLGGSPLFWKEGTLEKVYPSATGAHQIQTFSLEGVEQGAGRSLVVIEGALYYKSRNGVCVYTGTMPRRISEAFGDLRYQGGIGGRHGRKYFLLLGTGGDTQTLACYDIKTGEWYLEDNPPAEQMVTWRDQLYYITKADELWMVDGKTDSKGVRWWAESGLLSIELPEHKRVGQIRLRFALELGANARVHIAYDGGSWHRKGTLHGGTVHTQELMIVPRRCDHYRLRIEGTGGAKLYSISYKVERG